MNDELPILDYLAEMLLVAMFNRLLIAFIPVVPKSNLGGQQR